MAIACQKSFLTVLVGLSTSGATAVASDEQLEEVLVTARRTVENAQDVPVTVTAFQAERLANHDINTLEKLADALPDLTHLERRSIDDSTFWFELDLPVVNVEPLSSVPQDNSDVSA
jgi:hypothetical protein